MRPSGPDQGTGEAVRAFSDQSREQLAGRSRQEEERLGRITLLVSSSTLKRVPRLPHGCTGGPGSPRVPAGAQAGAAAAASLPHQSLGEALHKAEGAEVDLSTLTQPAAVGYFPSHTSSGGGLPGLGRPIAGVGWPNAAAVGVWSPTRPHLHG